ncbi:MAG TPA: hypothetical protein VK150_02880 [Geothrix sp.]|nr:hypothetical protein [Geothrix sp.]
MELFKELYNRNGAAFTAFEEGFNIKPFLEACRWRMNLSEKDTEELNRAEDFLAEMIRKGRA